MLCKMSYVLIVYVYIAWICVDKKLLVVRCPCTLETLKDVFYSLGVFEEKHRQETLQANRQGILKTNLF